MANGHLVEADVAGWRHALMYAIQAEIQRMQEWVYYGKVTDAMQGDESLAAVHVIMGAAPRHNSRILPAPDSGAGEPCYLVVCGCGRRVCKQ